MRNTFGPALLTATLLTVASFAHADLEAVTLSSEDPFPMARWMYGKGQAPKADTPSGQLAAVKQALWNEEYGACLTKADAIRAKAKSLQPWLAVTELDCAVRMKAGSKEIARVFAVIGRVEKNPSWLIKGPQAPLLRKGLVSAYLSTLDQDLKTNRARVWKTIDSLQQLGPYLDNQARAKIWRTAGELSFLQQKTEAAREFFRRSLVEVESEELRVRLNSIDSAIGKPEPTKSDAVRPAASAAVDASKDELELVDRVTTALKAGDLVPAIEDAAKLIRKYPGSSRAKWAGDRILEAYQSLADRTDERYFFLRDQMLKTIEQVDADRLADWARVLYSRGQYEDSYQLAQKALGTLTGARRTGVLDLAAKAALTVDKFDAAQEYFDELIAKHSGTAASREALFRSGLIHYRAGRNEKAAANFERLIALPNRENFEVLARYWLWRTLQRTKSDRAPAAAQELIARFPFSYYGLRARIEANGNVLAWDGDEPEKKIDSKIWLTSTERLTLEKAQLLMKAGWLDEAQAELRELPAPVRAEDKAVRSLLWAAAGQYLQSSKLVNEAWDEKKELRRSPFLGAAFPMEFDNYIQPNAATRKLEPNLVRGLIKQESGFNPRATSASNAQGLMQIIPPTAREIAGELKLGNLLLPDDMFQPKRNVLMGTYYISRMIGKYQGSVPLGLAAYNAGPARIDRWLRSRPSLKNLASLKSSAPDDEIWIDEIPYWETSFYVKAILRNLLIYRMLEKAPDGSRATVGNPLWAQPTSVPSNLSPSPSPTPPVSQ